MFSLNIFVDAYKDSPNNLLFSFVGKVEVSPYTELEDANKKCLTL